MTTPHEPDIFEPSDWESRPVKVAAIAGAIFLAAALAMSALTVKLVTRHRVETDEPAVFASKRVPPPPRLQTDEAGDLELFRRRQTALLSTYGWIDRKGGVVRLPIERAMALVAEEQGRRRP